MFVKIVGNEKDMKAFYECKSILMEKTEAGARLLRLMKKLDPGGPDDDQVCMSFDEGDQVFVMNDAGLTVDRYWF